MTTNNSKPSVLPIISDNQREVILNALQMLHGAILNYGVEPLPPFTECGAEEYERITRRARNGLAARVAHEKEQAIAHLRQGVKKALEPHIEAKRAEKVSFDAAFASVPEGMRSHIKPLDPTIEVPVSEFASVFPQGTEVVKMVVALKDMSYTVAKGKEGFYVRLQVPFTSGNAKSKPTAADTAAPSPTPAQAPIEATASAAA